MKRYILILGLAIIITVCRNANGSSQPPDSEAPVNQASSSFTTDYMNEAAGVWYYLYRKPYLPSTATEPAKIKNINPDFGGLAISDTATTQFLGKQAISITGDCRVFISSSNEGSRIQPLDLSYIGDNFQRPEFSNVRPLVNEIFSVYGNPSTNLGKLRVLRDWIARMAIHPHPPFHAASIKIHMSFQSVGTGLCLMASVRVGNAGSGMINSGPVTDSAVITCSTVFSTLMALRPIPCWKNLALRSIESRSWSRM